MKVRSLMFAAAVALILPIIAACGDDDSDGPRDDGGLDSGLPNEFDAGPAVIPLCGNGVQEGNETCDDGDTDSGDGCSSTCTTEASWECKRPGYACARAYACGDGTVDEGELCDDGNAAGGDGCSGDCKSLETNFACPMPNAACVSTMICGDGKVIGEEQCDDGNTAGGDGCSADCKAVEAGWACPSGGVRCRAAKCGDGKIAGAEQCDDGMATPANGDGCSDHCQIEAGWVCPANQCHQTKCGDHVAEGSEQCDDTDTGKTDLPFDGCYLCQREPSCGNQSACTAVCGDGIVFPGETCDDGNTVSHDGCSADCKTLEQGYACNVSTDALAESVQIPVIYRDFRGKDLPAANGLPAGHADFETTIWDGAVVEPGIVSTTLGANKKPVYSPTAPGHTTHGAAAFDQWYTNVDKVNVSVPGSLHLVLQGDGSYVFDDTYAEQQDDFPDGFFPIDNKGWVPANESARDGGHNFHFTSELRYWFEFGGGEELTFRGDDDVWVFINGRLAVDLGGIHGQLDGAVTLDSMHTFGMTENQIYEVVVFQAERHTTESSYRLTLNGFEKKRTRCTPTCGDGILTPNELCDEGAAKNAGGYGQCNADCQGYGPRCGDGVLQADKGEECDNGVNLGGYGPSGCTAECKHAAKCGDGKVDGTYGEQCDDGVNTGGYNKCAAGCKLGDRCGDGVVQYPEGCDDGNNTASDGCDNACNASIVI